MVVGGANIDIKPRIAGRTIAATSNPGSATVSIGGVGRNIAHNLAQLGIATRFIGIVGRDPEGDRLLEASAAAGVDVSGVKRAEGATGLYAAVLDQAGELVIGVSAMAILDNLRPADLRRRAAAIDGAGFVIADCNLRPDCLAWLLERTACRGIPLLIEPVSAPKAAKLAALLKSGLPLHTATPNLKQVEALAGRRVRSATDLKRAAAALHARGIVHLLIGLGPKGALLSSRLDGSLRRHRIPAAASGARDVTGGGDALVAGYVAALMRGYPARDAALLGQAAAGLAVATEATVNPATTFQLLERRAAALKRRMKEI